MIRGQAGQSIGAQIVSAATGAAFTGTVTVYITGDGGTQAIGTVGSGICTLEGNGYYTYRPSFAETDYALIAFTFVGTGAIPQTIQVETLTVGQQAGVSQASVLGARTALEICQNALREVSIIDLVDPIPSEMASFALSRLNRILNSWNAIDQAVYAIQILTFTTTPGLEIHTIGPTGTWVVAQRPETIEDAAWSLGGSPAVWTPIAVRDVAWWRGLSVPDLETTISTGVYYNPTWPNGELYFVPVPSVANSIQLRTRIVLANLGASDTFSMPPGYEEALTLTLAEQCAPGLGVPMSPDLAQNALRARARIFGLHRVSPRISTAPFVGSGTSRAGYFDWRVGGVWSS